MPPDRHAPEGRSGVRWGLGDFFAIYFAGVVAGVLLASLGYGITGDPSGDPGALTTALALLGQFGGWVLGLVWVSRRKGRGRLRADYGLVVRLRDGWFVVAGVGLEIALSLLILPIVNLADNEHQSVVQELEKAHGMELAVLALFAGLVAPLCEELLFRGLLLRSLARRVPAVWAVAISAAVFAAAHPLFDPSLGSLAVVPALFALGAISGVAALRSGELSRSIFLHFGFNLLTTFAALFLK
jgi:membrane protease YdiL (CAAX protease family)